MQFPPMPPLPPLPSVDQFNANRGVRLFYRKDGCPSCNIMAQALKLDGTDDVTLKPIVLPPLSSAMVECCAGIARALWRTREAQLLIALYIDVASGQWCPVVPQQNCSRDGVHCKLTSAGFPAMAASHRLAGSFRSLVLDDVDVEAEIPTHDGVHLAFDLESDWIQLTSFHRMGDRLVTERAEDLIRNDHADRLSTFLPQLRIAPPGWDEFAQKVT